MSTVFCHECGVSSNGSSKFCGNCGTELDLSILSSSKTTQQDTKMPSSANPMSNQAQGYPVNQTQGYPANRGQGYQQPSNKYLQPTQPGFQPRFLSGFNRETYETQNKLNNLVLILKIERGLAIFALTIITIIAFFNGILLGIVMLALIAIVTFYIQTWFINGVIARNNTTRTVLLILNGLGILSGIFGLPGTIISLVVSVYIVYVLMDQNVKLQFQTPNIQY